MERREMMGRLAMEEAMVESFFDQPESLRMPPWAERGPGIHDIL